MSIHWQLLIYTNTPDIQLHIASGFVSGIMAHLARSWMGQVKRTPGWLKGLCQVWTSSPWSWYSSHLGTHSWYTLNIIHFIGVRIVQRQQVANRNRGSVLGYSAKPVRKRKKNHDKRKETRLGSWSRRYGFPSLKDNINLSTTIDIKNGNDRTPLHHSIHPLAIRNFDINRS